MNTVILVLWNINVRSKLIVREERGVGGLNYKKGFCPSVHGVHILSLQKEKKKIKIEPQKSK